MSNYHVKFRVHYVGGTTDEFDEVISEEKYHWYSNGSQGSSRLAAPGKNAKQGSQGQLCDNVSD